MFCFVSYSCLTRNHLDYSVFFRLSERFPLQDLSKEVLSLNANISSEVIAAVLILVGTLFSFLSAVGLIRLPDVYTRSHAASKSSTLGVLCTLLGTLLYFLDHGWIFQYPIILVFSLCS